ncbi:hypothetical protein ACHAPO_002147 [Fusarium lateritium]
MKPAFSTLEVDIRGPHSTLEVDPRQYPADLEVKPADLKSPSDLAGEEQQPSDTGPTRSYTDPWYKRYWLAILVLSIIVTGGIIGGAIGGTLASKKDSKSDNNIGEVTTSSSIEVTTTTQSQTATTITTTEPTVTTTERSTIKPTSTPSPDEAPRFPIYIGGAENGDDRFRIAFVMDQTRAPWCSYQTLPDSSNPCGRPFILSDGFEYIWNGCGGDTWATWRNPSDNESEYKVLLTESCAWKPETFKCGNVLVKPEWLCGSSTS